MAQQERREKATNELVADLARETISLIHHEIALAKSELTEKGRRAGIGGGVFGAALGTVLFALACLTACVIAALQLAIPLWLSCLIVAVLYGIAAGCLALLGREQLQRAMPPAPTEAIESSKEDVTWIRTQTKSGRR